MGKIMVIYGHCSDLIEFEVKENKLGLKGLISLEYDEFWQDEIPVEDGLPKPMEITLKDGTRFVINYDDEGVWRIEVLKRGLNFIKLIKNEDRCLDSDRELYSDWLVMVPFDKSPIYFV